MNQSGKQGKSLHFAFLQPHMQRGGTEVVFDRTTVQLEGMGIRISYICPNINEEQWSKPTEHCSVYRLPVLKLWSKKNIAYLKELIEREGIDLIFYSANALKISPRLAQSLGVRLVPWLHNMVFSELVHKREWGYTRRYESPLRWMNYYCHLLPKLKSGAYRCRLRSTYRQDIRMAYRYIVLHQKYKDELVASLGLTPQEATKVLPMINTIPIEPKPQTAKSKEIVYIGRLCPIQKQVTRLIDIWSRIEGELPEWRLKIYGTGPDEGRIRREIASKGLRQVELCGYISNPSEVYATASILCLTSSYEGYPMVLVEAQNQGVVPISFDCCPGVEAIIGMDRTAGIIVPHLDHEAFAKALLNLCQDDALREELRLRCLDKRMDYRLDVNDEEWHRLIEDVYQES